MENATLNPDRSLVNTYDGADRLQREAIYADAEFTQLLTDTQYQYDTANNRIARYVDANGDGDFADAADSTYGYLYTNSLNQIDATFADVNLNGTQDSGEAILTSYTYDERGNRDTRTESGQTDVYSYDYENRLVELNYNTGTSGSGVYRYAYDYRTRWVLRDESQAGGAETWIVFSGGTSAQEWTESGTTAGLQSGEDTLGVEFVRGSDYGGGIGGILYTLRSGAPSFKHYNSRGDVVAATDGAGALTYQAAYEAFGKHGDTASSQEWGSTPDRQQANTKDEDPTGLLNEGFRYRDLETGTFITRDPLGFVDGPNVYTYVVQNPWTKFDPHGLKFDDDTYHTDDDPSKDRAKNWDELSKKTQEDYAGRGATEDSYNEGVAQFNKNMNEMRKTPFGSAQYDKLRSDEQTTFTFSFGYDEAGESAHFDPETKEFHFNQGKSTIGIIAHEFFHGIQDINSRGGGRNAAQAATRGNPWSQLYQSSDSFAHVPGKPGTSQWKEAQAERAQNVVENEYGLMYGGWGKSKVGDTYMINGVDDLRQYGSGFYKDGFGRSVGYYGKGTSSEIQFDAPAGSYGFREAFKHMKANR